MFEFVQHDPPQQRMNVFVPHSFIHILGSREGVFIHESVHIASSLISIMEIQTPIDDKIKVICSTNNTFHTQETEEFLMQEEECLMQEEECLTQEEECCICLSSSVYIEAQCGHRFCHCIQQQLLQYNKKCPMCRVEINRLVIEDRRVYDCMRMMNGLINGVSSLEF
jgi:hypothetical protein